MSYRDGYRAAARSRGLYRIVEQVTLPEELKPYQERLDQLTTITIKDEVAQASLNDEVWAITQLLRSHANLTHKFSSLQELDDESETAPQQDAPLHTLAAALDAIADRIRRLEHYIDTVQQAEHAEQRALLRPVVREQADRHSNEALDLLARASAGSLAPDLPQLTREARTRLHTAAAENRALQRQALELVESINALGTNAPPDLAAAAPHLTAWLHSQDPPAINAQRGGPGQPQG
ncbi:hypothetical protein ABZ656_49895 [Streptomyces sp. NPDC007095]|uniref:hypothetical protein n=1 Tax=Streptomyces sp. NPDC007095 TaxID=3154482 RepID=UPI000C703E4D